jgi:hypothetical protein
MSVSRFLGFLNSQASLARGHNLDDCGTRARCLADARPTYFSGAFMRTFFILAAAFCQDLTRASVILVPTTLVWRLSR